MKPVFFVLVFLLSSAPLYAAKSYICRSDGSVVAFENGEETQAMKPLKQHEIEEIPLAPKAAPTPKNKEFANRKSDLVPLTQQEMEARSR